MEEIGGYRIVTLIESDGDTDLYAAVDEKLGREVRVRILRSGISEEEKRSFEEAARAEAGAGRSSTVMHELGRTADGRPFMVFSIEKGEPESSGRRTGGNAEATVIAPKLRARRRLVPFVAGAAALLVLVAVGAYLLVRQKSTAEKPLVAMLPVDSSKLSADDSWMAFGVNEEVYNDVARTPGLLLIDKESTNKLTPDVSTGEAMQKLHADWLVRVVVSRDAGNLILDARIERKDGSVKATRSLRHDLAEPGSAVGDLALATAGFVTRTVAPTAADQLSPSLTVNPKAYAAYTRAMALGTSNSVESIKKQAEYLKTATTLDPEYYVAWVDLYAVAVNLVVTDHLQSYEPLQKQAQEAMARLEKEGKADAIDAAWWSAHNVLYDKLEFGSALPRLLALEDKVTYKEAIYLDIENAYLGLGDLAACGRYVDKEMRLDPLSSQPWVDRLFMLTCERKYDESIAEGVKAVAMFPDDNFVALNLAIIYALAGRAEEARVTMDRAAKLRCLYWDTAPGYVAALRGDRAEALRIANDWLARYRRGDFPQFSMYIPCIYGELGMLDAAFDSMSDQTPDDPRKDTNFPFFGAIGSFPIFDSLRGDPRFNERLAILGVDVKAIRPFRK